MSTIVLIIIVIIVVYFVKKTSDKSKVASGGHDDAIQLLENYYDKARANHDALGVGVISIGTYWFAIDGKIDSSSGFMSVCLRDGTNDNLARSLGMQVNVMEGKNFYQFVIKKKFSKTAKCEILKKLAPIIKKKYPDDAIKIDESIPSLFSMIDCQQMIDLMNNSR